MLKAFTEFRVLTPGGTKEARYIDVIAKNSADRIIESYQIGKQTGKSGPIAREARAISDITTAKPDLKPVFVPYNKIGK